MLGNEVIHPPIHPVKCPQEFEIFDNELKVYELITRHFFASLSPDAQAEQTKIEVCTMGETFIAKGIHMLDKGWLEVYPYEVWTVQELPELTEGSSFMIDNLIIGAGRTSPPKEMTEEELVAKMDKSGIGTDFTIHEQIRLILDKGYAKKIKDTIIPTLLGKTLMECYEYIEVPLSKPYLRAQVEKEINLVGLGTKKKRDVLQDCLTEMEKVFLQVVERKELLKNYIQQALSAAEDWKLKFESGTSFKRDIEVYVKEVGRIEGVLLSKVSVP